MNETLGARGAAIWAEITDEFELGQHEEALLLEVCRTADLADKLHDLVEAEGPVVMSPQGTKAHPALVELRQVRLSLARLVAAMRLPDGDESRPQLRAVRGVYK